VRVVQQFSLVGIADLAVAVSVAFVFAALIGAERQWRQRSAGLRTNVLVAVGAAAFVSLGERINGAAGGSQVTAYVVSGVGFLGAGVIMKDGGQVSGLNTAATLWCSAAVGALCGFGAPVEAALLTLAVLSGNTLLRPLVNAINRAPVDVARTEATHELWAVTRPEHVDAVRDIVVESLENAHYPISEVEVTARGVDASEVIATLTSTSVEPEELNAVCAALERSPLIRFASWVSQSGEAG
jgi:putative Mg2+ transporter-C (MgtC) family protein